MRKANGLLLIAVRTSYGGVLVHAGLINKKEAKGPSATSSKIATKFRRFNVNYLVPKRKFTHL